MENLLGTSWVLENYQSEDTDGNIIYPLGKDAEGIITFMNTGWMAVQIMAKNRDKIKEDAQTIKYTAETEKQMAELGYHAYAGQIDINETDMVLTTHVSFSVVEDYVGSEQNRKITLEGDTLYLVNTQYPQRQLTWKRL